MKHGVRFIDRTGKVYGYLTVLSFAGKNKLGQSNWLCRCECGVERVIFSGNLNNGHTVSCGCKKGILKHGENRNSHRTPEYQAMAGILQRCLNPKSPAFKHYGGRGITVCKEWNSMVKYQEFLSHIGRKPTPSHTVERIDNSKGYQPGNVRWATAGEQMRNTRRNIKVVIDGLEMCFKDACVKFSISPSAAKKRIRSGWPVELAIKTPPSKRHQTSKANKCSS